MRSKSRRPYTDLFQIKSGKNESQALTSRTIVGPEADEIQRRAERKDPSFMRPRELVVAWVEAFNRGNPDEMAAFYAEHAVNHQVVREPAEGRAAIREMFAKDFAAAKMVCITDHIFEDGPWAILEWRDPLGLRGCGFFRVENDKIVFQRGYWDRLSFLRAHRLPLDEKA
jgi:hypothetical protein